MKDKFIVKGGIIMRKERLKSIKRKTVYLEGTDYLMMAINTDDYRWLIKQAERVQDLENINRILMKGNEGSERAKERLRQWIDELEIENKRLRKALEFYAEGKHVTGYGTVARKALEGEE